MKTLRNAVLILTALAAGPAFAQSNSPLHRVGGFYYAAAYAKYQQPGVIYQGNTTTGAASITLFNGYVTLRDGTVIVPWVTNSYITVGNGSDSETVEITGVSGCNSGGNVIGTCTISATFANTHGSLEPVTSGTGGVQEAVLDAAGAFGQANTGVQKTAIGNVVVIDSDSNPTVTQMSYVTPLSMIPILDNRGPVPVWWTSRPTGGVVAAPAVRTTSNVSWGGTGTWDTGGSTGYYVSVACLDQAGNGSISSTTSGSLTVAQNSAATFLSPSASAGCAGWVAFGGVSLANQYLLVPTKTNCTLSTLVAAGISACAVGSSGTWSAPSTTGPLHYGYLINTYQPNMLSSQTWAYVPSSALPSSCAPQSSYGPFPATATGTAADVFVLASINLNAGCLNFQQKTLTISGKITGGATSTGTVPISIALTKPGSTSGTPTTICTIPGTALATKTYTGDFSCTFNVNATGSSGTIMPNGFIGWQATDQSAAGILGIEDATGAVTFDVTGQDVISVFTIPGTEAFTAAQILSLNLSDNPIN